MMIYNGAEGLRILDHLKIKYIIYDILRVKNELYICAQMY